MSNTELEKEFAAAGRKAAHDHFDSWFAINVSETGEPSEPGTVITEYKGKLYEVWLDRTWHEANQSQSN